MMDGMDCRNAGILHDHSLFRVPVPNAVQATTGSLVSILFFFSSPFDQGPQRVLLTNGTNVPQTVVDRSQPGTVLGVGNLGQEHGGSHLREGVSEPEQETSAHELRECAAEGLKNGTARGDDGSDDDGPLATPSVEYEGT